MPIGRYFHITNIFNVLNKLQIIHYYFFSIITSPTYSRKNLYLWQKQSGFSDKNLNHTFLHCLMVWEKAFYTEVAHFRWFTATLDKTLFQPETSVQGLTWKTISTWNLTSPISISKKLHKLYSARNNTEYDICLKRICFLNRQLVDNFQK